MLPHEEMSTRRHLLQLLKKRESSSISELSRMLGLTEMAIRRHLLALEAEGIVRSTKVKQPMGRPLHKYALTGRTEELFPRNYPQLALDLLGELEEQAGGEAAIGAMFRGRRDKLAAKYRERMERKPLEERVSELSAIQNAGGYMTEWEADGDSGAYALHEYNCPIAQVANRFRQACQCEKELFESLLDANVERTECLADGGMRCSYVVKPKT